MLTLPRMLVQTRKNYSITKYPSSGDDDGSWQNPGDGFTYNTSTDVFGRFGLYPERIAHIWIRFPNIQVPKGAVVNSASLSIRASWNWTEGHACRFYGNADDNATAPSSNSDARSKNRTTNYASWNSSPSFSTDTWYTSPSLVSVIQEIFDRSGWQSGNALMLFIVWTGGAEVSRRGMYMLEQGSGYIPYLSLEYSA